MIKCVYCEREHDKPDDIRCPCGAYGHRLKVDRNREWFWSYRPKYLKTKEVAQRLKISLRTAQLLIKDNKLPALCLGRNYRVREDHLEEFIHNNSTHIEGYKP
jgi:excisionase family DNA binding protein